MFRFHAKQHVPKFILNDKNGYAVAKAIEAAMQIFNDTLLLGVSILTDAETMPEWRLDEIGWEYGLPFDYTTTPEVKRKWVQNAYMQSRLYGTKTGVESFLKAIFEGVEVKEWFDYSGDPYHFRVALDGEYTNDNLSRVIGAVNEMRSVRSTFDKMTFRLPPIDAERSVYVGTALHGVVNLDIPEADEPDLDQDWLVDETNEYLADEYEILMTE